MWKQAFERKETLAEDKEMIEVCHCPLPLVIAENVNVHPSPPRHPTGITQRHLTSVNAWMMDLLLKNDRFSVAKRWIFTQDRRGSAILSLDRKLVSFTVKIKRFFNRKSWFLYWKNSWFSYCRYIKPIFTWPESKLDQLTASTKPLCNPQHRYQTCFCSGLSYHDSRNPPPQIWWSWDWQRSIWLWISIWLWTWVLSEII